VRIYDLPERVIDSAMLGQKFSKAEAQRELLRKSADRLGIATLQDLADFYRLSPRDAAPRIRELVEEGHLATIEVEGWRDTAYLSKTARSPRSIEGASLLSPFDPVVWFRPRAERLFGFEYRIEIYVPAERRRWGYYVLPFRHGDRIVARVDLKADRAESTLLARAAFAEHHADENEVAAALADELGSLGRWLGLEQVRVECRRPFGIKLRSAATRR